MKISSSVFFSFFLLIFSGCTYNLIKSDFQNTEQYYNQINEFAKGRTINLSTKDSTFSSEDITINEDSLTGIFKWGEKYPFYSHIKMEKQFTVSSKDIKSISLTKRTSSIPKGMGIGALIGAVWGGTFIDIGGDSNSGHHPDYFFGGVFSSFFGAILGGLVGGIVGDDYVYSFDERLTNHELYQDNSVHKFGLKIGYHEGFSPSDEPVEGYGGNIRRKSKNKPGFSITFFYNYPLGKSFSLNPELSYISAGSNETYSVRVNQSYFSFVSSSSIEDVKIIETAFLIRLNLVKSNFTPYLILGPKFDILFPPTNSLKEKFYNDINKLYGGSDFSVSGKYKRVLWGAIIGVGLSTGKLLPYEILVEARYNYDISSRFKVNSYGFDYYYYKLSRKEIGQISHELQISVGVAIF